MVDPKQRKSTQHSQPFVTEEPCGSFRKLGLPYFGVLIILIIYKDPTIQGTILGSPNLGNSHVYNEPTMRALWEHDLGRRKHAGFGKGQDYESHPMHTGTGEHDFERRRCGNVKKKRSREEESHLKQAKIRTWHCDCHFANANDCQSWRPCTARAPGLDMRAPRHCILVPADAAGRGPNGRSRRTARGAPCADSEPKPVTAPEGRFRV